MVELETGGDNATVARTLLCDRDIGQDGFGRLGGYLQATPPRIGTGQFMLVKYSNLCRSGVASFVFL